MSADCTLSVINNLCVEMLLGLDLIRALKLVINPGIDRPLSFAKSVTAGGVRLQRDITLPPRSLNLILANVNTDASIVVTRSYNIDSSIIVANTVDCVKDKQIRVLIANIDTQAVILEAKRQVASFDEIYDSGPGKTIANSINAVLTLDDTSEVVQIGDDLSNDQISDLQRLVKKHIKAFSINGELGLTPLAEHRIQLKEGTTPIAEPLRRRP